MKKQTKIIKSYNYILAANILKKGGVVAFPTETVYGLGADATNESAILKIFKAKSRPNDNPLIIHIADFESLFKIAIVDKRAQFLGEKFWPGPLTLILKNKFILPKAATSGLDTVAVRMPKHQTALSIIKEVGFVAAPSANISTRPSATNYKTVFEEFDGKIDAVLKGNVSEIGIESTVLDLTSIPIKILRPGMITASDIEALLNEPVLYENNIEKDTSQKFKSPGMKYKHYSPNTKVEILKIEINNSRERLLKFIIFALEASKKQKVGCILFDEDIKILKEIELPKNPKKFLKFFCLGSVDNPNEVAKGLFKLLRELDNHDLDIAYGTQIPNTEIFLGIKNRFYKASQGIIEI